MSTVGFGYNILHYPEYAVAESLAEWLYEKLPHGSGINYNWHLTFNEEFGVEAYNNYDAFNDNGFECHTWPFYVIIPCVKKFNENGDLLLLDEIDFSDIRLGDVKFIDCDPENDCPEKWVTDEYFAQFEKDEFGDYAYEVYDNAPYSCGTGLKDYLEDTIYTALKY